MTENQLVKLSCSIIFIEVAQFSGYFGEFVISGMMIK